MKKIMLSLDALSEARDEMDRALQEVARIMHQKGCLEGHAALQVDIETVRTEDGCWSPTIRYKTTISVPVRVSQGGRLSGIGRMWADRDGYKVEVEGEQMKLEV